MTATERTIASLRRIGDAHRKAGFVPVEVIDVLVRELQSDDGPGPLREPEALAKRTDLDRGPHGFPAGLRSPQKGPQ